MYFAIKRYRRLNGSVGPSRLTGFCMGISISMFRNWNQTFYISLRCSLSFFIHCIHKNHYNRFCASSFHTLPKGIKFNYIERPSMNLCASTDDRFKLRHKVELTLNGCLAEFISIRVFDQIFLSNCAFVFTNEIDKKHFLWFYWKKIKLFWFKNLIERFSQTK